MRHKMPQIGNIEPQQHRHEHGCQTKAYGSLSDIKADEFRHVILFSTRNTNVTSFRHVTRGQLQDGPFAAGKACIIAGNNGLYRTTPAQLHFFFAACACDSTHTR
jgi:hypothetical protein